MRFGILCAMAEELKTLKEALHNGETTTIAGVDFYQGTIHQQQVVLVQSGIGKVQAGMTTAMLITNFDVQIVINSGSAGGIGADLAIGDVVVSTKTAYHDVDATAFDYEYGQLPQQPLFFPASEVWGQKIMQAAKQTGLKTHQGLIVSGDQFVAGQDQIQAILKHFPQALSAEMEGAAVGQACYQFKTPYVVVRAMSDVGNEDAGVNFDDFIVTAGKQSAQMLLALLASEATAA